MTEAFRWPARGRKTRYLGVAVVCALLLPGCGRARAPDTRVVAIDSPIRELDPRLVADIGTARISRLVFRGLTRALPNGEVALDLAEAITPTGARTEDGRPLRWRVRLREGLRFHDGAPLRAADVCWTYRTILDPTFGSVAHGAFRSRLRAVLCRPDEPRVVEFVLRRPVATFLRDIVMGIVPRALAQAADRRFAGYAVGSGPFRVVDRRGDVEITLERTEPVPGAPRRVRFRTIADEGSRALSVLGGGADVAVGGMSPTLLDTAGDGERARVVAAPGIAWAYLGLNLGHPPLDDPRVRRALALAIDKRALVRDLLGGRGRPSDQMMPPEHAAHASLDGVDVPWGPDLRRAAALLDEAGLPQGPADAPRFVLSLSVSTSRFRRLVARAVGDQLARVGVAVDVRSFELGTFLADVRAGRFESFLLLLPEPVDGDLLAWMFHSQNAARPVPDPDAASVWARLERRAAPPGLWSDAIAADPRLAPHRTRRLMRSLRAFVLAPLGLGERFGVANRTGFASPRLDALVERARELVDPAARAALYRDAARIVAAAQPVVPLWWEHQTALVRNGVPITHVAADGGYGPLVGLDRPSAAATRGER